MLQDYDAILAIIPMFIIGIPSTLSLLGIEITTSILIGATPTIAIITYTTIINPPIHTPRQQSQQPIHNKQQNTDNKISTTSKKT